METAKERARKEMAKEKEKEKERAKARAKAKERKAKEKEKARKEKEKARKAKVKEKEKVKEKANGRMASQGRTRRVRINGVIARRDGSGAKSQDGGHGNQHSQRENTDINVAQTT